MTLPRVAAFVLAVVCTAPLVAPPTARAQQLVPVQLVPDMGSEGWRFASEVLFTLGIRFPWSCGEFVPGVFPGTLTIRVNGQVVGVRDAIYTLGSTCAGGEQTVRSYAGFLQDLAFGTHALSLEYSGSDRFAPSRVDVPLRVRPDISTSYGAASLSAGTAVRYFGGMRCTSERMEFSAVPASEAPPPPGQRFPYGFLNYRFENCVPDCDLGNCSLAGLVSSKATLLEYPADIPPGARLWVIDTSDSGSASAWAPAAGRFDGRFARTTLSGTRVTLDAASQSYRALIQGAIGLAMPEYAPLVPKLQGMWWGGPGEEGWGLSVAQAGERLFLTLHDHDEAGRPAFYVVHDGSWDAARSTFSGTLYRPNARTMGGPVGTLHLLVGDPEKPLMRVTLPSGEGLKPIERMAFGPEPSQPDPSGIWDLTLAGTGAMTITRLGEGLFLTWLEFPAGGSGTWIVAPAGRWSAPGTFEATLYRTTRTPLAAGSDTSRLRAQVAGSLKVRFTGADDAEVTYTIDGTTQSSPLRRHAF